MHVERFSELVLDLTDAADILNVNLHFTTAFRGGLPEHKASR